MFEGPYRSFLNLVDGFDSRGDFEVERSCC